MINLVKLLDEIINFKLIGITTNSINFIDEKVCARDTYVLGMQKHYSTIMLSRADTHILNFLPEYKTNTLR